MKNLDAIYFAVRELAPEDRPAYLTKACAGDHELRARVQQMLAVSAEAEAFITDLPDDDSEVRTSDPGSAKTLKLDRAEAPDEAVGQTLGRYKLLERLGEGGCGVVYVAEQTEPVRRRVALKVIKLGMDTREVIARFEAERQALAMMDHPNIAKVLDAGTTDVGRPFFVMELVRGTRITDYSDKANLSTKERLDLFIKVCQAIQHAHQKGIIHRDIKPSNILVTLHDGVPVPKVIDFGIAKATEGRLTDATVYTQLHQFIGTPAYMSPEQAGMSSAAAGDIDTRSDIYSLGVLLYEMLAGSTPFDARELMASGIDAMRKAIREKEPVRPSTKFATLQREEMQTAAKRRSEEAPKLIHLLQGDLDWIVMKCMEKDRTRRYETANGLAADLKRHLTNEPVLARRPTTAYQLQKAFRRHRLAFAATATVTAALLIGIVVSTWQAVRATRAEREQVKLREAAVIATTLAKQETKRADEQAETNRLDLYAADMQAAQIALKSLNYGKARQLLERHLPRNGEKDLRGFEWRMLWQQSRGDQLEILRGHSNTVVCVVFSPDGKYLLSGSADRTVVVWDASNGRKVNSWKAHGGSVNSVSLSPDGKIVATGGGDGVIKLWQWPGAGLMETITNSGGYAEFHPSEMLLFTASGPSDKNEWNSAAGALLKFGALNRTKHETVFRTPPTSLFPFPPASFSVPARVNELVAVGGGGHPVMLMNQHGALIRTLNDSRSANSLAFSPKGDLLAVTFGYNGDRPENEIRIHDPATGKLLVTLTNHIGRVPSVKFSPDGKWLASASSDQTIRLWDTTTWQQANVLKGHGNEVWAVAFSPDGKHLASASMDETVCIWNVQPEHRVQEIKGAEVLYASGNLAAFMRGGELFAARSGDHITVWNVTTGRREHEFAPFTTFLGEDSSGESILTLIPRAGIVVLQFWDGHDFRLKKEVRVQADVADLRDVMWRDVSLNLSRQSLLLSLPGEVVQIDCANGSILRHISLPGMTGFTFRLSSDETTWAAFVPRSDLAGVGPTAGSHEATGLEGHRDGIRSLVFSPTQGLLATASFDNTARLWDAPSGRLVAVLHGHKEGVIDCAFSADGRTLATASGDRTVKLWHVHTQRDMLTLTHDFPVAAVAFSREGNRLATETVDGTYHFWRAASWEQIKTAGAPVRSDYERGTTREGRISTVSDTKDDATRVTRWQRRRDDHDFQREQGAPKWQKDHAARILPDRPLALKDWGRSGSRPGDYTIGPDDSTTLDGQAVVSIKSKESRSDIFETYEQAFQAKDFLGKGIRLSARIKAESIEHWAILWMRVDGPNGEIFAIDTRESRHIKGTRDWAKYEIVLYVSNRAKAVSAGLSVIGTGQAWISDVQFTVVPEAELYTELLKEPGAPPF